MVEVEKLILTPEVDEAAGKVLYRVSIGRAPLSALDEFAGRAELAGLVAQARRCGEQIEANEKAKREEWEVFLASRKPKDNFRRRIGKGPSSFLPETRQDETNQTKKEPAGLLDLPPTAFKSDAKQDLMRGIIAKHIHEQDHEVNFLDSEEFKEETERNRKALYVTELTEGEDFEPAHVVGGQHRREQREHPEALVVGEGVVEHVALGPEARERRDPDDGQPADAEGDRGPAHVAAQRAHALEVLLVMEAVDHRSRPEEEERLEERVHHHQEDGGGVGARADGQHHVADLRHGGEREHALDVGLHEPDARREDRGDRADPGDDLERHRRHLEQLVAAGDHVDARGHHGGGVDQRRHRRGPFHGVRQPDIERNLGRLSTSPHEQEHGKIGRAHV